MLRAIARASLLFALVVPAAVAAPDGEGPLARRVTELLERLSHDDFAVREGAYRELRALGEDAIPHLEGRDSGDPEVSRRIQLLLAEIRHAGQAFLVAALDSRGDGFAASEEFARMVARGRSFLPALLRVIREEDARFPNYSYYRLRNAYAVLGELTDQGDLDLLLALLDSANSQHRHLLRPILEEMDPEAMRAKLVEVLSDEEAPPLVRAQLIELCINTSVTGNDPRIEELGRRLVDDPSEVVRAAALRYVSLRRDEALLPRILARCRDDSAEVRAAALRALRNHPGPRTRATLTDGLLDPEPAVRSAALQTLRSVAGPDLAPRVRPFLKDPDPTVRSNAAQLLAGLGDRTAIPTLINLLAERDDEFLSRTLHSVVDALGSLAEPAALEPLFALLDDAAEYETIGNYRWIILRSIVKVGGPPVLDRVRDLLLDPEVQNVQIALDEVARLGAPEALPILLEALERGDTRMRTSAIRGLAGLGQASAAPLIAKALAEEPDLWFRSEAIKALTAFRHEEALPEILKSLEVDPLDTGNTALLYSTLRAVMAFRATGASPRVAEIAAAHRNYRSLGIEVLGALGSRKSIPALRALLPGEESDSLRHSIALALARCGDKALLEERVSGAPEPGSPYQKSRHAEALLLLGRTAEAVKLVEEAVAAGPEDASVLWNAACVHALAGDPERALAMLELCLDLRTWQKEQLLTDPDLAGLRRDPRFAKLLERAR